MRRRLVAPVLAVVALSAVGAVNLAAPPDAPVPPKLSPYLEAARNAARLVVGLAAFAPVRLADAGCTDDGHTAVLAFVTVVRSRAFATIRFPVGGDPSSPDWPVTITGSSQPGNLAIDPSGCLSVPGPPGG